MKVFSQKGFTLLEVVIAITILLVLGTVTVGSFVVFQKRTEVKAATDEMATMLKLAQSKALAAENNAAYGIYLNTTTTPHQYVLFQGNTYATRTVSADKTYALPSTVEFSSISLGGGNEINFQRLTGSATAGNFSVRLKSDTSQSSTIYVSASGTVAFVAPATISDTRAKDSRHVSFAYSRSIATATESVTLNFNSSVNEIIPITSNLISGQLYWTGTVTVGGTEQEVTLLTTRLNGPDTEFHVYRDRRYNDKTLRVTISGDTSGNLANYSADGATTNYSSVYVSNLVWQ